LNLKNIFRNNDIPVNRCNNFNILRISAAIMVIYGHMSHLAGFPVFTVYGQAVSTIGVKIFFIISGYLITESFLRDESVIRYTIRRFFRIVPGLVLLCFVTVFIFGALLTRLPLKEYLFSPLTYNYFYNILFKPMYFLPGVFENNIYPNAVNGSLWSLQIEVYMYIVMPLFIIVFKKFNFLKQGLILSAIFFTFLNIMKLLYFPNAVYVFWGNNIFDAIELISYFFVGAIFTFPRVKKLLNLQMSVAFAVVPLLMNIGYIKLSLILTLILPYFIFSYALSKNAIFAKIGMKNDYSYGLYLYGFLVQQVVMQFLSSYKLSLNTYFLISTLLTLLCAVLSWHIIEKPFLGLGKKILNPKIQPSNVELKLENDY
jgi:peptidoglycan/LPS O-acetylase OafA/YrhL